MLIAQAVALEQSNAELEQFAYVASHDLQEPLRNVRLYSELLIRRYSARFDEDGGELLRVIMSGADRMTTLVRDLLAYSRVVHETFDPKPVDLAEVLEIATGNCATAVEECSAKIHIGPVPVVYGSRTQLIQVFQNLISNSIRYRG